MTENRNAAWAAVEVRVQAEKQLAEHKEHLKKLFRLANGHGWGTTPLLEKLVDDIHLKMVKIEDRLKENGKPTVSVLYEYPNLLYDYLSGESCPPELKASVTDGFLIKDD